MPNYHLFVVAVRCNDSTAEAVESTLRSVARSYGGPEPLNWTPDHDTVVEGFGPKADFNDVEIHDLNPLRPE